MNPRDDQPIKFDCKYDKCKYDSNDKNEMLQHIFIKHSQSEHFKSTCFMPNCKRSFNRFSTLENHVNQHENVNDALDYEIKCDVKGCHQIVSDIDQLYKHYYCHIREFTTHRKFLIETAKTDEDKIEAEKLPKVRCFYQDCWYVCGAYKPSTVHAFQSHLWSKHSTSKKARWLKENVCKRKTDIEFSHRLD